MKKTISCFIAASLAFQCVAMDISAAAKGTIEAASIGVESGETFTLPVKITENPGITAIGLSMDYDSSVFELISVEDTGLLEGAEFLAGDDTARTPYLMNWDDISEDNHKETGVLANVKFRVKDTAEGEYKINFTPIRDNTYDVDLKPVTFESSGGKVTVRLSSDAPMVSATDVFGIPDDIVQVDLRLENNPGLIGLGLSVYYDTDELELVAVDDGGLLGDSEFLSGKDLKKVPYILNWDDLTAENNTGSGVLASLRFKVLTELTYPSQVSVELNKGSVFDADLKDVDLYIKAGSVKTPDLSDLIVMKQRMPLEYSVKKSSEVHNIAAEAVTIKDTRIDSSSFTNDTSYNNGFSKWTDCIHEKSSTGGPLNVFYDDGDTVAVYTEDSEEPLIFTKEGWSYGAGTIGDDGCYYILWGTDTTDEDIFRNNDLENICLSKYDSSGKLIKEAGLPNTLSGSMEPFHAGNAAIGWKDGVVIAFYDTLWKASSDGLHHQGSCYFAVDTTKMKVISGSGWQGSHSFGVSMTPTDYGFAAIQMGDASSRGIVLNLYGEYHGRVFSGGAYGVFNGSTVIYNASGQYGTNERQLDGNTTYTHMGGIAHSKTTYALAGKSEREYTSEVHYEDESVTNIYDVFVRMIDQDFDGSEELAGVDRTDSRGNVIDTNVVWLTECDEKNKAGTVKVAALDDGAYCVLWEKFIDGSFDSVRYVILDECGNILRPESAILNARLSDNSTQPWTDGYTLKWAVSDGMENTLTIYTADLLSDKAVEVPVTTATTAAAPVTTTTTSVSVTETKATDTVTSGNMSVLSSTVVSPSKTTTATKAPVTDPATSATTKATAADTVTTAQVTTVRPVPSTGKAPGTTETSASQEVPTETSTSPAEPPEPALLKGDVNSDGFIDSSDASQILEAYANLSTGADSGLDEAHYKAADVNEDNIIDSTDASVILSYYAFISTGNTGTLDEFMEGKI